MQLKVSHALQIVVEFEVRRSPGHCLHQCDATCTPILDIGSSSACVCFAVASLSHANTTQRIIHVVCSAILTGVFCRLASRPSGEPAGAALRFFALRSMMFCMRWRRYERGMQRRYEGRLAHRVYRLGRLRLSALTIYETCGRNPVRGREARLGNPFLRIALGVKTLRLQ